MTISAPVLLQPILMRKSGEGSIVMDGVRRLQSFQDLGINEMMAGKTAHYVTSGVGLVTRLIPGLQDQVETDWSDAKCTRDTFLDDGLQNSSSDVQASKIKSGDDCQQEQVVRKPGSLMAKPDSLDDTIKNKMSSSVQRIASVKK